MSHQEISLNIVPNITPTGHSLCFAWKYKGLSKLATNPHHEIVHKYIKKIIYKNNKMVWLKKYIVFCLINQSIS